MFKREGKEPHAGRRHGHAAGADRARRGRHDAEHHLREGVPGTFQLDAKKKFFQPHARRANGDGRFHLDARSATASSPPTTHDGRFVTYYGDNHPRYAGNVVKAMASAKDGYPARRRRCSRDELATLDPARAGRARRARGRALVARLDDELVAARRGRRAADADDRRGDREGAGRGAALPAGAVLPAAELRVAGAARRRATPLLMEGHRADRRVGRQGEGAAVADRARAGRVEPAGARTCRRASRSW